MVNKIKDIIFSFFVGVFSAILFLIAIGSAVFITRFCFKIFGGGFE